MTPAMMIKQLEELWKVCFSSKLTQLTAWHYFSISIHGVLVRIYSENFFFVANITLAFFWGVEISTPRLSRFHQPNDG
jgi:hypothetical protein